MCVCMCYMEYHSAIKKNEILPFAMDGTTVYYPKWSKSEKDKYYMISLICGIKETKQMNIGEVKEK